MFILFLFEFFKLINCVGNSLVFWVLILFGIFEVELFVCKNVGVDLVGVWDCKLFWVFIIYDCNCLIVCILLFC